MSTESRPPSHQVLVVERAERSVESTLQAFGALRPGFPAAGETDLERALDRLSAEPDGFRAVVLGESVEPELGRDFLARLAELAPRVLRVWVGCPPAPGAADAVAHLPVPAPLEARPFRTLLERALGLHDRLDRPFVAGLLHGSTQLPSLPATYRRISAVLARPEPDILELVRIVETDASLSARIFALVHSSWFGLQTRIHSLRDAVLFAGTGHLQRLALQDGLLDQIDVQRLPKGFDLEASGNRALVLGRLAERILGPADPLASTALLAGSLTSLGQLLLAAREPAAYGAVLCEASECEANLLEVERRVLGTDHAEVGAFLLAAWGLPDEIVDPVLHLAAWTDAPLRTRRDVVHAVTLAGVLLERVERGDRTLDDAAELAAVCGLPWKGLDWLEQGHALHADLFGAADRAA